MFFLCHDKVEFVKYIISIYNLFFFKNFLQSWEEKRKKKKRLESVNKKMFQKKIINKSEKDAKQTKTEIKNK